jgi:metallophosphoesterase superfamily enzyme
MSLVFVHLSDIHFGQEKGGAIYINKDVRERLLDDAYEFVRTSDLKVDGIIVTGDLAYGGSIQEYEMAGKFLDDLAERVSCPKTAVQIIPGNHDIHRPSISSASRWMLNELSGVTSRNGNLCTLVSRPLHFFSRLQSSGASGFALGILKKHEFLYA